MGSKRNETQVSKVLNFKPWVGKMQIGQNMGEFIVIIHNIIKLNKKIVDKKIKITLCYMTNAYIL